jgi:hypothetical protein
MGRSLAASFAVAMCVLAHAASVCAQGIEITPFAGYRFGGDFFEIVTGRAIDRDGAPSVGAVVDVPLGYGLQVEGLFTHQSASLPLGPTLTGTVAHAHAIVEHYQAGGLQEFGLGRARPYLTGSLGVTRYALSGDNELRLAVAGGGGVKLFPTSAIGVRLDGRIFTTFVDVNGGATVCTTGRCFVQLHVDLVWQAEFVAGLVVRLR